jgi:uncharacterized repeat protein (TIGR03803 family)
MLFSKRTRSAKTTPSRLLRRSQLQLEQLEHRCVPSITTLATFNGANGASSVGALVEDSHGNLFGTTLQSGAYYDGTVFEVASGSGTITTLATFKGTNGADPAGGLVVDASGNLFGTTFSGGPANSGTVFEIVSGSGTITTLASFNGTNGNSPNGGLVEDSLGNLFGTTAYGGTAGDGTVFEVAAGSGTITTLASFNGTNGAYPSAGLVRDASGNLFGTASAGGTAASGTVFEVASGSGAITTLASFNGANGSTPSGRLVEDASGNLFGTASSGGASAYGTVFKVASGSGAITTLATFNRTNGDYPSGNLALDASGNLFGTTAGSISTDNGTVFEVASGSGTITTLATFSGTNGSNPSGGLVTDGVGNFFGTAQAGGTYGAGTVFQVAVTQNQAILDNGQAGYAQTAGFINYSDPNAYGGTEAYAAAGTGANTATWSVPNLAHGTYALEVTWTAFSNRATNATYKVYDGATLLGSVTLDQTKAPAGGVTLSGTAFQSLGNFTVNSGTLNVVLSDNANGYVIADALDVQQPTLPALIDNSQGGYSDSGAGWVSFNDPGAYFGNERYVAPGTGANTATWQTAGLASGVYDLQVDWTAFANRADNATYQVYDGATLLGSVKVNQKLAPTGGSILNGVGFQSLGRFTIASGTVKVVVSDNADGYVIADAMLAQQAAFPAVVDNSQFGYTDAGVWASFSDPAAYLGNERYAAAGTGSSTATWQASGLAAGVYDVQVDWTPFANRATNATYKIYDGATLLGTTTLDQTKAPTGGALVGTEQFQSLGRFAINSGSLVVVLSNSANGYVIADSMLAEAAALPALVDNGQYGYSETGTGWTSFADPGAYGGAERYAAPGTGANTATWVVPIAAAGTYNVQVDWTPYSNRATNATYQVFDGSTLLATTTINQTLAPSTGATVGGVTFQSLGRFPISSGAVKVVLSDSANGYVVADAMYVQPSVGPIVSDNGQFGYSETGTGWTSYTDPNAFGGSERYAGPGSGANTATWSVAQLPAGVHNVEVNWTAFANRATNATYQIFDGATLLSTVMVDQTQAPTGGAVVSGVQFQSLGSYTITSGTLRVVLTDSANGVVVADAVVVI